jgi:HSP20 family protein
MRVLSMTNLLDELVSESFGYVQPNNDYIVEKDDSFEIEIDMPGVVKEDIELSVEDDYLTIIADRKPSASTGKVIKSSKSKGYLNSYKLGAGVSQTDIKAKYDNGVLKVTVGKKQKPKENKIVVE